MEHTPENGVVCIKCHECCKWMTFIISVDSEQQMAKYSEFYRRRGCRVVWYSLNMQLGIMVPYTCPELRVAAGKGFCAIYDKRPQLCRDYDGRWDPHMRERCQLPTEGNNG
jgi:Fe-S-cluster containining protein